MKALITGVGGMDGSHLADLLTGKGYEVHGIVRRYAVPNFPNIQHLVDKDAIQLHEADLADQRSLDRIIETTKPDELYAVGAQSHVGTSFQQPEHTINVTGLGALRLFESVRHYSPRTRVYQASSSEMLGNILTERNIPAADESTRLSPVSPYGAAKVLAHHLAQTYRQAYGLHISSGILHNHESARRGTNFLTRKVTLGIARMLQHGGNLQLGNPAPIRDWGHAPDYCDAMWRMLQQDEPDDYVIATGEGHTVKEWVEEALRAAGAPADWLGTRITFGAAEFRPTDILRLVGDAGKAREVLKWEPTTRFSGLVKLMVDHDMAAVRKEAAAHA